MPRRAKPLTDAACRNLKPDPTGRTRPRAYDGGGLLLEALPSGRKVWRMKYQKPSGGESLAALGDYPAVTLAKARALRLEAMGMLANGLDPNEAGTRRAAAEAEAGVGTLAAVIKQWANAELASTSPDYQSNTLRRLERYVLPYIGKRPITEIHASELVAIFDRIREGGREESTRRVRMVIGQIYRWAIRRGLANHNPTDAFRGERRTKPRGHFAAMTAPDDVGRLMRGIWSYNGTPEVCALLKLSALLFQRPGEIRAMEWADVNLDAAEWRYIVSKTRSRTTQAHLVPLPLQAVTILRDLQPLTDRPSEYRPDLKNYVFPSPKTRTRPLSENAARQALRNLGFTNDEHTPHGFRATARSLLAEMGWKIDAIERQLSHNTRGPLGDAYDRAQFLAERRQMMQAWADYLDRLRLGESKVAPIRGRLA